MFAAPLTKRTSPPQPAVAGTSTPVPPVHPGSTPTPASLADQPHWDGDLTELTAFYSLDGGMWRLVANYSYREGPDGVHWEWPFDPVSVNVKTLETRHRAEEPPWGRWNAFSYPGRGRLIVVGMEPVTSKAGPPIQHGRSIRVEPDFEGRHLAGLGHHVYVSRRTEEPNQDRHGTTARGA